MRGTSAPRPSGFQPRATVWRSRWVSASPSALSPTESAAAVPRSPVSAPKATVLSRE
jgi:hypothetical protein